MRFKLAIAAIFVVASSVLALKSVKAEPQDNYAFSETNTHINEGAMLFSQVNESKSVSLAPTVAARLEKAATKEVTPEPAPLIVKPKPAPVIPEPPKPTMLSGLATWYSHGTGMTAASRQFPKGTKLKVIAVGSGRSIEVVVNDYGPRAHTGIDLDLNKAAFAAIAPLGSGKIAIKYYKI